MKLNKFTNLTPREKFAEIKRQVRTLAEEVKKNHSNLSAEELAGKIMEIWGERQPGADQIHFISIKPCLCFTIGFWGREKKIHVDL